MIRYWRFERVPSVMTSPTNERWRWVLVMLDRDGREIRWAPPDQPHLSLSAT